MQDEFLRIDSGFNDTGDHIVCSTWNASATSAGGGGGSRPVAKVQVVDVPLTQSWEATVKVQDLRDATGRGEMDVAAFADCVRAALAGKADPRGMKTGVAVKAGAGMDRELVLFVQDAETEIEFDLMIIPVRAMRKDTNSEVWTDMLTRLVGDRADMKSRLADLEREKEMTTIDLDTTRANFDGWRTTHQKKNEAQLYRKFVAILNEKKAKIRALLKALEEHERMRKAAEEDTERLLTDGSRVKVEEVDDATEAGTPKTAASHRPRATPASDGSTIAGDGEKSTVKRSRRDRSPINLDSQTQADDARDSSPTSSSRRPAKPELLFSKPLEIPIVGRKYVKTILRELFRFDLQMVPQAC
ncbi:hypothetical protein HK101_002844 [Irineochytrium annulatum]|nr:hypothetical protein HK101_002844 [Irineochytrium annulatum]